MGEYPLGTKPAELERLALQQRVWGPVTARLLERAGPLRGGRVVDLGCGPGLLLDEWLARVGPPEEGGEVVLVDEAERWHEHLAGELARRGAPHVRPVRARLEELALEPGSVDLLFARWVFSFLPDPAAVLARLAPALKPGGRIALQDYNHEGVSLFPESAGFRAVVRATRAWYAAAGGDTFVAGRLPALLRAAGLETVELRPNVLCGGPGSPAFRWAGAFFPLHVEAMEAQGLLTAAERRLFLEEWAAREADPDALFFSPIVLDALARRNPGSA